MAKEEFPELFTCTQCKKVHAFGGWVCAHWYETIVHTCDGDGCGAKHHLLEGKIKRAIPNEAGKQ